MKSGTETAAVETKGAGRLASLDAVRGFDMFFIMGGEGLVVALAALFCFPDFGKSFDHVPWDGLQFMDTIFPTFLFLAGVTFPFSAASRRSAGASTSRRLARRCSRWVWRSCRPRR